MENVFRMIYWLLIAVYKLPQNFVASTTAFIISQCLWVRNQAQLSSQDYLPYKTAIKVSARLQSSQDLTERFHSTLCPVVVDRIQFLAGL